MPATTPPEPSKQEVQRKVYEQVKAEWRARRGPGGIMRNEPEPPVGRYYTVEDRRVGNAALAILDSVDELVARVEWDKVDPEVEAHALWVLDERLPALQRLRRNLRKRTND